jgi:hypothetical protein
MTTRTARQERAAQALGAICGLVITALFVVSVIAARGDVSW